MWFKMLPIILLASFSLNADFPSIFKQKTSQPVEMQKEVSMCVETQKAPEMIKECPTKCAPVKCIPKCPSKPCHCQKPIDLKPAILVSENACHCSIFMDALYWKPGISEWIVGYELSGDDTNEVAKALHKDVNWGFGGKFGINFSNIYDWTIGLVGTYYNNDRSFHVIEPLITDSVETTDLFVREKVSYMTIDLNFSSQIKINHTISLLPIIGAKYVAIKNKAIMDVIGLEEMDDQRHRMEPVNFRYAQPYKFIGIGPQVGATAIYKLGKSDFDFYGSLIGALVYGNNKNTLIFTDFLEAGKLTAKNNFYHLKGSMQIIAGLEWKHHFEDSNYIFGLHAAYEANIWYDIGNATRLLGEPGFFNDKAGSNFTIQGGNFGMTFDF